MTALSAPVATIVGSVRNLGQLAEALCDPRARFHYVRPNRSRRAFQSSMLLQLTLASFR
jgi:hypothetical protein